MMGCSLAEASCSHLQPALQKRYQATLGIAANFPATRCRSLQSAEALLHAVR